MGDCFFTPQFYANGAHNQHSFIGITGSKSEQKFTKWSNNGVQVVVRAIGFHVFAHSRARVKGVVFLHLWGLRSAPSFGE